MLSSIESVSLNSMSWLSSLVVRSVVAAFLLTIAMSTPSVTSEAVRMVAAHTTPMVTGSGTPDPMTLELMVAMVLVVVATMVLVVVVFAALSGTGAVGVAGGGVSMGTCGEIVADGIR